MGTENIERFLRPPNKGGSYTDEKLAELLAHTESGKLAFYSCCCFVGAATADHALKGDYMTWAYAIDAPKHITAARQLPFAIAAELEFSCLGRNDGERQERLLPLIHAEIARRDTENWKAAQEEPELADMVGILPIGW